MASVPAFDPPRAGDILLIGGSTTCRALWSFRAATGRFQFRRGGDYPIDVGFGATHQFREEFPGNHAVLVAVSNLPD